jgi:D-alanyl-D-alanine carboxypeptidase
VAFLFMKKKLAKYSFAFLTGTIFLWFYFQLSTYPYKVARWFQPIQTKIISNFSVNCSQDSGWLKLAAIHGATHQGSYSSQIAYKSPHGQLSHCEIGYQKEFLGRKVKPESRYRYASTSKLITTSAISALIASGKMHLDDKLVSFFPELKNFVDDRVKKITVAHLLNHRAGFNRLTLNGDPMFLRRNKPWCPNDLNRLQTLKLSFNPGEKQIYSNMGYCLLGAIIQRVTGESYRAYIYKQFSLEQRNIKFINDYYYGDEVRYDYRYEEWYNDSYLKLFDFEAISSSAGLSGSATALSQLLWDIHHKQEASPFLLRNTDALCNLKKINGCLSFGVFHYQPNENGITLHFHEGYLPGSASVAVIDSFGGVTVLVKSGANRPQRNPEHEWIRFIYKRLSLQYTMQGKVPILESFIPGNNH